MAEAGSLEFMPSSQEGVVLPARMQFSIRRRYVAGHHPREHGCGWSAALASPVGSTEQPDSLSIRSGSSVADPLEPRFGIARSSEGDTATRCTGTCTEKPMCRKIHESWGRLKRTGKRRATSTETRASVHRRSSTQPCAAGPSCSAPAGHARQADFIHDATPRSPWTAQRPARPPARRRARHRPTSATPVTLARPAAAACRPRTSRRPGTAPGPAGPAPQRSGHPHRDTSCHRTTPVHATHVTPKRKPQL
jgi:hypothetical protein